MFLPADALPAPAPLSPSAFPCAAADVTASTVPVTVPASPTSPLAEPFRPLTEWLAEASVGKSISMKRFATRARGRSSRIIKPFSQIRVVVREQEEA